MRLLSLVLVTVSCALPMNAIRSAYDLPPFTTTSGSWRDLDLPMRDGVKLKTHILMPEGAEHAPIVFMRMPYAVDAVFRVPCDMYARYGLGCVVQDVRGQRESEGEWTPLINERKDGEDTLAWLEAQPWVDSIALSGQSYLAGAALAASHNLPKKVKTIIATVFGASLRDSLGEGGLMHHELITAWSTYMPGRERTPNTPRAYRQMLDHRPHFEADEAVLNRKLPFYRDWLEATSPDAALWSNPETLALEAVPADIHVPVLIIAGFDDPFLRSSLALHEHLASKAESLLALIPANHIGMQSGDLQVEGADGLYTFRLPVPWLLHYLKGEPLPYEATGVKIWARGATEPRVAADWPGETTAQTLVLESQVLSSEPCAQRHLGTTVGTPALLSYRYNPLNPWPSEGGARGLAFVFAGGVRPGPVTQSWDCRRDVVRFSTDAMTAATRLVGSMSLGLVVHSTAEDTAFVAKLVDIDAQGRAVHMTDGAVTLNLPSHEDGPYQPNSQRSVTINFWPTEWVLQPGHRLGLWVSSSSYPMFAAHLNTARSWYRETSPLLAEQTLELGGPSTLTLHTLP